MHKLKRMYSYSNKLNLMGIYHAIILEYTCKKILKIQFDFYLIIEFSTIQF